MQAGQGVKGTLEHKTRENFEVGFYKIETNQGGTAGLQSRPCNDGVTGAGLF